MAKEPTLAIFKCQTCGRSSSADARKGTHILPFMRKLPIDDSGMCRNCGGELWTLSVRFTETSVDGDDVAIGMAFRAATGVSITSPKTASNQLDYADVPANVIARLNEYPRQRMARIAEFSRMQEREKLKQQGGRECGACGTLFVPTDGKPWAEMGYCSKMCLVEAEGATAIAFTQSSEEKAPVKLNIIEIACSSGHRFDVQKSFSGMLRPCPECGEKTRVP